MYDVTTDTYPSTTSDCEWAGLGWVANSADSQKEHNCTMEFIETYAPHGPFIKMKKNEKTQQEEVVPLKVVTLKVLISGRAGIKEGTEVLPKYNRAAEIRRSNLDVVSEETVVIEEVEYTDEDGEGPVLRQSSRVKKTSWVKKKGPVKAIQKVKRDGRTKGTRKKRANSKVEAQEEPPLKKQKQTASKTKVVPRKVVTAKVVTPRVQKPKPVSAADAKREPGNVDEKRQYEDRINTLEREASENETRHKTKEESQKKELEHEIEKNKLNLCLAKEAANTMMFGAAYQRLNNEIQNQDRQHRVQQSMAFAKDVMASGVSFESLSQAQMFLFGAPTPQHAVSNVTNDMFVRLSTQHLGQWATEPTLAVLGATPVQQTNDVASTPTQLLSIGAPAPTNLAVGPAPTNLAIAPAPTNLAVKDEPKKVRNK
jgi:hypothetical protein